MPILQSIVFGGFDVRMRVTHKPGDTMQVDWAGGTIPYFDPITGEEYKAYLFVAALPCSSYLYVEAYRSPHSWRHLHATIMIESGVDVKTVQSCLGHSSCTTTMSCYLHSFQSAQAAAMDAVANAIRIKATPDSSQEVTSNGI